MDLAIKYTVFSKLANSSKSENFGERCPSQYLKIGMMVDKWVYPRHMDTSITWLACYQNYHKVIIKQFPKDIGFSMTEIRAVIEDEINYYQKIQTVENLKYSGNRHCVKLNTIIEDEKDLWLVYENQMCKTSL